MYYIFHTFLTSTLIIDVYIFKIIISLQRNSLKLHNIHDEYELVILTIPTLFAQTIKFEW